MFGLGSLSGIMGGVKGLIGAFKLDPEKGKEFEVQMESLIQQRDSEIEATIRQELQAKERILVAELTQGSGYTKAARPTVVYYGLFAIFANYTLIPCLQWAFGSAPEAFELPTEFWVAWGGIVSTWAIGRSAEKRGVRSKATSLVTGNKTGSSLID